ncbi:MAG: Sec-independent protein translocase protein TatB [Alphaproteobacteria bacterium]
MMDFSWSEILLIAVVALMVVRPKDLPQVLKVVAQFARKARAMAREFQSGVEEMVREAELHEVRKEIESAVSTDLAQELDHSIDPGGTLAKSLDLQAEAAARAPVPPPPDAAPSEVPAAPAQPVAESEAEAAPALKPPSQQEPAAAVPLVEP